MLTSPGTTERPQIGFRALWLILAATAFVYLPCLRFDFVYDDPILIVNNPRVHAWQFVPSYFQHHFWFNVSGMGSYYRPLVLLWLRINYALFGPNPAPWHASSILVHLLAVGLVFLLLRRTAADALTVVVATGVFALHPAHIEAVTWIAGVSESLMTVALLASLLLWLAAREKNSRVLLAAAMATYLLSLLVKETAAVAPFLVLLYAYVLNRRAGTLAPLKQALKPAAIYATTLIVVLIVRWGVLRHEFASPVRPFRMAIANLPAISWFYAKHLLWPLHISVIYDFDLASPRATLTALAVFLIVMVALVGAWAARKSPDLLVAWGWIVFPMATVFAGVTSFDAHDYVHERYLYLPVLGFGIALGVLLRQLPADGPKLFGQPALRSVIAIGVLCGLASATEIQIYPWMNNRTLFTSAIRNAPQNPLGYSHLAFEMYQHNNPAAAVNLYRQAVKLDPNDYISNFGLAVMLYRLQQWEGAAVYCARADQISPNSNNACYHFQTLALMQLSRWTDAEIPIRYAIAQWPREPGQHLLLGQILLREHNRSAAQQEFTQELQIDPNSAEALAGINEIR